MCSVSTRSQALCEKDGSRTLYALENLMEVKNVHINKSLRRNTTSTWLVVHLDCPASIAEKMIKTPWWARKGFSEAVIFSRVLKDKERFAKWEKKGRRLEGGVTPEAKSHHITSKWVEVQGVWGGTWWPRRMGIYQTQGTRTSNHAVVFRVLPLEKLDATEGFQARWEHTFFLEM